MMVRNKNVKKKALSNKFNKILIFGKNLILFNFTNIFVLKQNNYYLINISASLLFKIVLVQYKTFMKIRENLFHSSIIVIKAKFYHANQNFNRKL